MLTRDDLVDIILERLGKAPAPAGPRTPAAGGTSASAPARPGLREVRGRPFLSEYDIKKSTAALAKHGLRCPPLPSYMEVLLRYFLEHYRDSEIRRERWWERTA